MKTLTRLSVFTIALIFVFGTMAFGGKPRKLPASAYIKSAKIEILSGKQERYDYAIAMLDSLFLYYGPHAEGLYLMGQIMVDGINATPDLKAKAPYLEKMVAYFDSLKMCCANKKIKRSYRKDCKKFITIADSLKVKYWRDYLNDGLKNLKDAEELKADMEAETDSSAISFMQKDFDKNVQKCIDNMQLAIIAIPDSSRPYLIIDKAYGLKGDYKSGIEWLKKALDKAQDSGLVLLSIAYDYIQSDDYCGAIPFYRRYVDANPMDTANLINLSICYNNCGMLDSGLAIYYRILEVDSNNVEVYSSIGRYYNTKARTAADSASKYQQEGNDEKAKFWTEKKREAFDSSRVYFKKAFELKPDDPVNAEQYGLVCALLEDYENAAVGFKKLTELVPDDPESWISLGDCYLTLKQFKKAADAYEKVVELEPNNVTIWEHLRDLYFETKQNDKLAKAEKKLKELTQ